MKTITYKVNSCGLQSKQCYDNFKEFPLSYNFFRYSFPSNFIRLLTFNQAFGSSDLTTMLLEKNDKYLPSPHNHLFDTKPLTLEFESRFNLRREDLFIHKWAHMCERTHTHTLLPLIALSNHYQTSMQYSKKKALEIALPNACTGKHWTQLCNSTSAGWEYLFGK